MKAADGQWSPRHSSRARATFKTCFRATRPCAAIIASAKQAGHHGLRSSTKSKGTRIYDKRRIEKEVGIAQFNALCRESVIATCRLGGHDGRMGFWVDLQHAYFTLHNDYIDPSGICSGNSGPRLIYRLQVVPYDPRIGATLSSTKSRWATGLEDPSVFVRFRSLDEPDTYFLVWTRPVDAAANLLLGCASRRGLCLGPASRGNAGARARLAGRARGRGLHHHTQRYRKGARRRPLREASSTTCPPRATSAGSNGRIRHDRRWNRHRPHRASVCEDDFKLGQQYHLPVLHAGG